MPSEPDLLERRLPYDLAAEQAVIGSVFIGPECLDSLRGRLVEGDFFDEANRALYRELLAMRDEGLAIDSVVLVNRLKAASIYETVGGAAYLYKVAQSVPNAAHAIYYADIVVEKARLRGIIAASTDSLREAYEEATPSLELLSRAEDRLFSLRDQRSVQQARPVSEVCHETLDQIDRAMKGEGTVAIPTGFTELDRMLAGGFRPGELVIVAARPAMGKAQPLDTKVLTPTGFVDMGAIQVGDLVIGDDGKPHAVTAVFPQGELDVLEVTTTDGRKTRCCADHLWLTQTRKERKRGSQGSVKTTRQIMETITREDGRAPNHVLPLVAPSELVSTNRLPISPYLLGLLLGDGSFSEHSIVFCKPEMDLWESIGRLLPDSDTFVIARHDTIRIRRKARNGNAPKTLDAIRSLGLCGASSIDKFIPETYLTSSPEDRLQLLRGLLDTDGHVTESGCLVEFASASSRLTDGVVFLARSLGAIVSRKERITKYTLNGDRKPGAPSSRLYISFPNGIIPVSSQKHLAAWSGAKPRYHLSIESIIPIGKQECKCIRVDSTSHLYVTDDFIVTHNSALSADFAVSIAADKLTAFFSLEMTAQNLCERMLSSVGSIEGLRIRNRTLSQSDWQRLVEAAADLSTRNLQLDDNSQQRVGDIAASVRMIEQRTGQKVELIVVDYLQFIAPEDVKAPREQQVANTARRLKALAKSHQCPVVAVCAVNRKNEDGNDKRPKLGMLRESGSIEFEADIVLLLHREDYYRKGEDAKEVEGLAEVIVAKQRNGPTGTVELRWDAKHTRFQNLAPERLQEFDDYNEGTATEW